MNKQTNAPGRTATMTCARCPNDSRNPTVRIGESGLCDLCQAYTRFDRAELEPERTLLESLVGSGRGQVDALVGISGGKDSTACLIRATELGFTPRAFTFDTGYYPPHIAARAIATAEAVGVGHEIVDVREMIRPTDAASFQLTADLYDEAADITDTTATDTTATDPAFAELSRRFRRLYAVGRRRYSVRHTTPMPYVRTCQLCRRLVVRAYHALARRHGVRVVLLGTNEWVGLSQRPNQGRYRFSAIRALRPDPDSDPVYVVHLPFLLGADLADTQKVLARVGWRPPDDEQLVESSANSCLLSRAAEAPAARLLGFHPDTSRLAREATVGFLTREQATAALAVTHPYPRTVRQVLTDAGIL